MLQLQFVLYDVFFLFSATSLWDVIVDLYWWVMMHYINNWTHIASCWSDSAVLLRVDSSVQFINTLSRKRVTNQIQDMERHTLASIDFLSLKSLSWIMIYLFSIYFNFSIQFPWFIHSPDNYLKSSQQVSVEGHGNYQ